MIQLTCAKCKKVLSIDDGFAGGACRCQHCGTVQTVPTKQAKSHRQATPGAAIAAVVDSTPTNATGAKTLLSGSDSQTPENPESLDDLAQYVQSSGLSGTGLRSTSLHKPTASTGTKTKPKPNTPFIIAGASVAIIVLGIVIYFATRSNNNPSAPTPPPPPGSSAAKTTNTPTRTTPGSTAANTTATPSAPAGPAIFMDVPLKGSSVVYLLDHGQGTINTFPAILGATIQSLQSLPKETKFQVIFWKTDKVDAFPPDALKPVSADNIEECKKLMRDVVAFGSSDIVPALEKALAQNPAEIIIVSGKNGLEDDFVKAVLDLHKGKPSKIHTFSVGPNGSSEAMKKIAQGAGGAFRDVVGQPLMEYQQMAP